MKQSSATIKSEPMVLKTSLSSSKPVASRMRVAVADKKKNKNSLMKVMKIKKNK